MPERLAGPVGLSDGACQCGTFLRCSDGLTSSLADHMTKPLIKVESSTFSIGDFLSQDERGVILEFRVRTRAVKEGLFLRGEELILNVNAKAQDNEANERVMQLLSAIFSVPKSKIDMVRGKRAKHKRILFNGKTEEQLMKAIGHG